MGRNDRVRESVNAFQGVDIGRSDELGDWGSTQVPLLGSRLELCLL